MNSLEPNAGRGALVKSNASPADTQRRLTMPNGMPFFAEGNEPPGMSSSPNMATLFQAFRRRWPLAIGLGLAAAVIGVVAVLFLFPAKYNAFALVEVSARQEQLLLSENRQETDFLLFKASMQSLVKSPLILNSAIYYDPDVKDLALVRDPDFAKWLEFNLKTNFLRGPEILEIALGLDNPEEAARVVNAVANAFLKEVDQRDRKRRQDVLAELMSNYRAEEQRLNQKRIELRNRELKSGIPDLGSMQARFQAAYTELSQLKGKERETRVDMAEAEKQIASNQTKAKDVDSLFVPKKMIDDHFDKDPQMLAFFEEKGKIQKLINATKSASAGESPAVRQLQANLQKIDKQIDEHREKVLPDVMARLRIEVRGQLLDFMEALKEKLVSLNQREKELQQQIAKQEEFVRNLNPASQPDAAAILAMREEIARMEKALETLNSRIVSINVEPAVGTRVRMLLPASPPSNRDHSKQVKLAGVAGFGMFGLLIFGVSFWEFRTRRISATEEVVHGLGMSLVGTVPSVPDIKPGANGTTGKDLYWQSQLSEAVDSIRTMLLHVSRKEDLKVVMITSAVSGEGKTSLASQLAASLARAWRKTLLIDGDLRNPSSHKLFDLPQEPGFSEVLRGEIPAADAVKPTLLSRLWLLPAGHWDSHAIQALAQDGAKNMLQELKGQYDFIIVDSSPVLPVADTLLLAQHVDAAVFSILRDVSRMPAVHAAQQRLDNLGVRVLGAVVLGANNEGGYMGYGAPARAG